MTDEQRGWAAHAVKSGDQFKVTLDIPAEVVSSILAEAAAEAEYRRALADVERAQARLDAARKARDSWTGDRPGGRPDDAIRRAILAYHIHKLEDC